MNLDSILNKFKPNEYLALDPSASKADIDAKYKYWRFRLLYSVFIGYIFFYFSRKTVTFLVPELRGLGYSYAELGLLSTVMYLTYGISKFLGGILSDRANPRYFMATALIMTGVFNILFGLSNKLGWFAFFWGCNGLVQGCGWPPITKVLTYWYSKNERGLWWSICSTSHNVGGAIIPFLVPIFIKFASCVASTSFSSWRFGIIAPGIMCVMAGFWLLDRLRDVPQTMGLPPVEVYKNEISWELYEANYVKAKAAGTQSNLSFKDLLVKQVLANKIVWLLGLTYFMVYVIRTAMNDLTLPYLIEVKGLDRIAASTSVFWLELGGLLGMLIAGVISDQLCRGKRLPFVLICSIGMAAAIWSLWRLPGFNYSTQYWSYLLMAIMGFFIYGPQMLVGIAAAEHVDKQAACTANGFVGWLGYFGAALTGYPLGKIIDYSWDYYFILLIICSLSTFVILLPFASKTKS